MMPNKLYGLVLVGGQSQRMGRDKATLRYHGETTQIERSCELLAQTCQQSFVSLRQDQAFPLPVGAEPIYDQPTPFKGPLCGIVSALRAHPKADWLVIACDLPFLDVSTLRRLIAAFQHAAAPQIAAFRSAHDGMPEPLCAIYPAGSEDTLLEKAQMLGKHCPRKLLIELNVPLIELDKRRALDNINTPEEFEAARSHNSLHEN